MKRFASGKAMPDMPFERLDTPLGSARNDIRLGENCNALVTRVSSGMVRHVRGVYADVQFNSLVCALSCMRRETCPYFHENAEFIELIEII